jgi:PAS domain S-box-containing protein
MVSETRFQELSRYVRLDSGDAELLRAFGGLARPELPRIARAFYDRIREHDDSHAVLRGEDQIQRLQQTLVAWLERVCGGTYDEAYHEQTSIIGRVHVRIGLPQRYMFTAMALIRVELLRIADRELGERAAPTREAIVRILDLDLAIMLEAYKDSFVARIEQAARQEQRSGAEPQAAADQRYTDAVELAGVMLVSLDSRGCIQLFNREAERITGFARDEVLGEPFVAVLGVEDEQPELRAAFAEALARGGQPRTIQACLRTRAGKLREVAWSLRAAENGQLLLATGRDVTDERAREEHAGQHKRLAAVGTLAAGLAHEIRNPLNGAQVHVAFLKRAIQRDATKQEVLEAADVVGHEIKRLADLVTEFLDFARPSLPAFEPTSLSRALEQARGRAAEWPKTAGVHITCDLPGADVEFSADPGKLSQLLLNLIDNAVEAGSKAVRLRGRRGPRQVLIDVEDDGPGLPRPDAPIFDAFYSTKVGGTGLGLAVTHRIVSDHHGTIDVDSRPGRTTFRIALPLEQDAGDAHEPSQNSRSR